MDNRGTTVLKGALYQYLGDVIQQAGTGLAQRSAEQLESLAERGDELLTALEGHLTETCRELWRTTLAEEPRGAAVLTQLQQLRQQQAEVQGPHDLCAGLQAMTRERFHRARHHLERASLCQEPAIAAAALQALAELHGSCNRPLQQKVCLAAALISPGEAQDLEAARRRLSKLLARSGTDHQAIYHMACLLLDSGEVATAQTLFLSILGQDLPRDEPYLQHSEQQILTRLAAVDEPEELLALATRLCREAPAYAADHPHLLHDVLTHHALGEEGRVKLHGELSAHVESFADPREPLRDLTGRALRQDRAGRLQVLLALARHEDLASAGQAALEDLGSFCEAPPHVTARVLSDLWEQRVDRILGRPGGGVQEVGWLRQALVERLTWLGEAVRAGPSGMTRPVLDLNDLLDLLIELRLCITEEPPAPLDLVELLPREDLHHFLLPPLAVLFRRLRAMGRRWVELSSMERVEATIRAICAVDELPEYNREELIVRTCEWLIRWGGRADRIDGHVRKAQLCSTNRLYDAAVEHAKAAIEIDPDCAEAHYQLGLTHMRLGKRLLALESLQIAAERHGHPAAFAEMAADCQREEEPAFAARYFIAAVEHSLQQPRRLTRDEIKQTREWLMKARRTNDQVSEFDVRVSKAMSRKERRSTRRYVQGRNAQLMIEKVEREAQICALEIRLKR